MRVKYLLIFFILFLSCFPYLYYEREKVLINNVDVDQTLCISEVELKEGGFDSVLTLWALRDQIINERQAERIKEQYFQYIDKVEGEFQVWHLAWAIANFYRWNDENVKKILEEAYLDAKNRPEKLKQFKKIADEHINGKKIYAGDIHDLGRNYARTHIVVKGNKKFIQSFDDYIKNRKDKSSIYEKEYWLDKCNKYKEVIKKE